MNYEQNHASQVNLSLFQNMPENFNDSREDLLSDDKLYYSSSSQIAVPNSNSNLSVANHPGKWITSSESLMNANQMDSRTSLQASAIDVNLPNLLQWNPVGSNASLVNRAQSSSCLDLANSNSNLNNNLNKEHLKSLLPTYRPAPSYEAAIKQKYRGSQPDVGQYIYENCGNQQSQMLHYPPDVTQHTTTKILPHYSDASDYGLQKRFKMMTVQQPSHYPANRLSSTSTPDLALASHRALYGYKTQSGSSPDITVSSRTLLHSYLPPNVLYSYTSVAPTAGVKHRLRHSHSFLPHATYENLNFIETANPNLFHHKPIPNNLIYRTASAAAAQQMADMEYYLHKQQKNHSLNALNLSSSHISEPIYENFPMPSYKTAEKLKSTSDIRKSRPIKAQPLRTQPPIDAAAAIMTNFNNSNKNINESSNGNENSIYKQQQYYLAVNSENNNDNNTSGSRINVSQEKDVNLNNIPSMSASATSLYQNQQIKQRQQKSSMINTSGTSSNYTINSVTTDSGISSSLSGKKEKGEKRNKIWNILSGGGKSKSSSSKNKSATLGREKDRSKEVASQKSKDSDVKHRWSTGLPRLQPLPANISKEKLCQLLETKLNDSQLFLEFERIPKRKENAQYSCALHDENRNKNSDRSSLPMDENRVKITPTRENRMGYANASHITVSMIEIMGFLVNLFVSFITRTLSGKNKDSTLQLSLHSTL